jgi:hypothetical protein
MTGFSTRRSDPEHMGRGLGRIGLRGPDGLQLPISGSDHTAGLIMCNSG